jgi:glycosyltransferase involved in cell wall biosynthesis
MAPDFSIIVPTRDRPAQFTRCLQALSALRFPTQAYEVVVVDDGSAAPLDSIVRPFLARMQVKLVRQTPEGPAAARNRGAALARGRFLAFTDDDCAPASEWIEKLAIGFRETPGCVIGGRTVNAISENVFSAASQSLIDYLYAYYNGDPDNAGFVASNNLALPAEVYASVHGFSASYPRAAAEDRDLCGRLRSGGFRIRYVKEALVFHRHSLDGGSFWKQHFGYGRGAFHFHGDSRARSGGGTRVEPPVFYTRMLSHPFRTGGIRRPAVVALLFVCSQFANASGFLWEAIVTQAAGPKREHPMA